MKHDLSIMQIFLPVTATAVEMNAAEELKAYIRKMTGVSLPVVIEGDNTGAGIYVGATDYAAVNNVTYTDKNGKGEGWAIKAIDNNLVLTGGNVRGVLYAVYHLLEDVLGVRWWNLWEEEVPTGSATVPDDYMASGEPTFKYRDIFLKEEAIPENANYARMRWNGHNAYISPAYGGKEAFGPPYFNHTFALYIPPYHHETALRPFYSIVKPNDIDYYVEHPEWFNWNEALQKRVSNQQLCLTNEGLINAMTERVLATIACNRQQAEQAGIAPARYFALSPNDGQKLCQCEKCVAQQTEKGNSGYLLTFVNRIAEAVAKVYPDVRIETLAYSAYTDPPKDDTRAADNVVVTLCTAMDMLHDINHPNNAINKARIETWNKLVAEGNFHIWDYVGNLTYNGICPSMMQYGVDFKAFHDLGLDGFFGEYWNAVRGDFWDMKFWLMSKQLENPTQTAEEYSALMNDFLTGYYGEEAGIYVRQYLDYVDAKAEAYEGAINLWSDIIHPEYLNVEDLMICDGYFEQAFAAASGNEKHLRRLRAARSGLDRVIIKNMKSLIADAESLGIPMTLNVKTIGKRLATAFNELMQMRGAYDADEGKILQEEFSKYLQEDSAEESVTDIHAECVLHNAAQDAEFAGGSVVGVESGDTVIAHGIEISLAGNFDTWNGAEAKKDENSFVGSAIVCDVHAMQLSSASENSDRHWAMNYPNDCIPIRYWEGTFHSNGQPVYKDVCRVCGKDIIADGKYHLYKFEDVVLVPECHIEYLAICNNDCIQALTLQNQLSHLKGRKVDLYISLKVTGDITCTDPGNMPIYYFDRFIVVE